MKVRSIKLVKDDLKNTIMATESKLKETKKISTTVSMSTETKKKEVPKGAKILSRTVRTETEEIENGWLISKNFDISFEVNGNRDWAYYTKKWYTKNDPLTVKVNDKSLADEFDANEE